VLHGVFLLVAKARDRSARRRCGCCAVSDL